MTPVFCPSKEEADLDEISTKKNCLEKTSACCIKQNGWLFLGCVSCMNKLQRLEISRSVFQNQSDLGRKTCWWKLVGLVLWIPAVETRLLGHSVPPRMVESNCNVSKFCQTRTTSFAKLPAATYPTRNRGFIKNVEWQCKNTGCWWFQTGWWKTTS